MFAFIHCPAARNCIIYTLFRSFVVHNAVGPTKRYSYEFVNIYDSEPNCTNNLISCYMNLFVKTILPKGLRNLNFVHSSERV